MNDLNESVLPIYWLSLVHLLLIPEFFMLSNQNFPQIVVYNVALVCPYGVCSLMIHGHTTQLMCVDLLLCSL